MRWSGWAGLCGSSEVNGADAKNVELADTSGLTGVSEEVKTELAEKKAKREKLREADQQRKSNPDSH